MVHLKHNNLCYNRT